MKLQTKLIIAFSSIVIVMGLFQFTFIQKRIENVFGEYVSENQMGRLEYLKDLFIDYYKYNESWAGIQEVFFNADQFRNRRGPMWKNNLGLMGMSNFNFSLADENGTIIGDMDASYLGEKASSIPGIHQDIIYNGKKIGELIVFQEKSMELLSLERQFIQSVNKSILFGSLIAVVISVLLGLFIARKVTMPLEGLMVGIRHLTKGDKSYRLTINTKDEFHKLADAFNEMSNQLEQNEQVRKNLVADVAHELRTPLAILRGRLESIQEGAIEPSQEIIIQLNDEVFRLTRLVNDLQQLSLAESGKLPLNIENVSIDELIQRIVDNFEWLADEKKIELQFSSVGDQEKKANIDKDRITQVIVNILGNALRHTPENGKVIIELAKDNIEKKIVILISDSGAGISPDLLPYIFDRFYRTDSARNRDQGGTGLGLAIAKGFVEAHQGDIEVKSEIGRGTTFIIQLPL